MYLGLTKGMLSTCGKNMPLHSHHWNQTAVFHHELSVEETFIITAMSEMRSWETSTNPVKPGCKKYANLASTVLYIPGKSGGRKVWWIDSFRALGKRKFGKLI